MKRLIGTIAAITLTAGAAHAGLTQPANVDVDLVGGTATGDQVSARYSSNLTEYIGCGIRKIQDGVGGHFTFGFCQAKDAAGEEILCNTEDAGLLDVISSSGDYGLITFSWNTTTLECRRIGFSNQSFYLPKKLDRN
jgi:hypothetical protein